MSVEVGKDLSKYGQTHTSRVGYGHGDEEKSPLVMTPQECLLIPFGPGQNLTQTKLRIDGPSSTNSEYRRWKKEVGIFASCPLKNIVCSEASARCSFSGNYCVFCICNALRNDKAELDSVVKQVMTIYPRNFSIIKAVKKKIIKRELLGKEGKIDIGIREVAFRNYEKLKGGEIMLEVMAAFYLFQELFMNLDGKTVLHLNILGFREGEEDEKQKQQRFRWYKENSKVPGCESFEVCDLIARSLGKKNWACSESCKFSGFPSEEQIETVKKLTALLPSPKEVQTVFKNGKHIALTPENREGPVIWPTEGDIETTKAKKYWIRVHDNVNLQEELDFDGVVKAVANLKKSFGENVAAVEKNKDGEFVKVDISEYLEIVEEDAPEKAKKPSKPKRRQGPGPVSKHYASQQAGGKEEKIYKIAGDGVSSELYTETEIRRYTKKQLAVARVPQISKMVGDGFVPVDFKYFTTDDSGKEPSAKTAPGCRRFRVTVGDDKEVIADKPKADVVTYVQELVAKGQKVKFEQSKAGEYVEIEIPVVKVAGCRTFRVIVGDDKNIIADKPKAKVIDYIHDLIAKGKEVKLEQKTAEGFKEIDIPPKKSGRGGSFILTINGEKATCKGKKKKDLITRAQIARAEGAKVSLKQEKGNEQVEIELPQKITPAHGCRAFKLTVDSNISIVIDKKKAIIIAFARLAMAQKKSVTLRQQHGFDWHDVQLDEKTGGKKERKSECRLVFSDDREDVNLGHCKIVEAKQKAQKRANEKACVEHGVTVKVVAKLASGEEKEYGPFSKKEESKGRQPSLFRLVFSDDREDISLDRCKTAEAKKKAQEWANDKSCTKYGVTVKAVATLNSGEEREYGPFSKKSARGGNFVLTVNGEKIDCQGKKKKALITLAQIARAEDAEVSLKQEKGDEKVEVELPQKITPAHGCRAFELTVDGRKRIFIDKKKAEIIAMAQFAMSEKKEVSLRQQYGTDWREVPLSEKTIRKTGKSKPPSLPQNPFISMSSDVFALQHLEKVLQEATLGIVNISGVENWQCGVPQNCDSSQRFLCIEQSVNGAIELGPLSVEKVIKRDQNNQSLGLSINLWLLPITVEQEYLHLKAWKAKKCCDFNKGVKSLSIKN